MRTLLLILFALAFGLQSSEAQILDKIKRRAKQEQNKAEDEVVDEIFKKKKKKNEKDPENQDQESGESGDPGVKPGMSEKKEQQVWMQRYDFKPGKEIIFFDDFENEELGEIPSKWRYVKGLMEIIRVDGEHGNVLNGGLGYGHPNWDEGYSLPEAYTIEFDVFIADPSGPDKGFGSYGYQLKFSDRPDMRKELMRIFINPGEIRLYGITSGKVPGVNHEALANTWNHISISVNGNSVKAYFNDYRMFNARIAPGSKPIYFNLWNCCQTSEKPVFMIDNFKVAAGAHPKYKQEILEGKIVTNNIHFETGSAKIIPRSFAEIKRVADVMMAFPDKKFSIEGHTDNVGGDESNLKLSKARAASVQQALVDMGIEASRLSASGYGEALPLSTNTTPEGRAMNRRVEFVVN